MLGFNGEDASISLMSGVESFIPGMDGVTGVTGVEKYVTGVNSPGEQLGGAMAMTAANTYLQPTGECEWRMM